ncbi:fibronectin type III domain-containing protein [Prevotella sp. E15-22]|uniref:fibronectin type III domain-containing protein n=1 Tax=Prevotella sp. E15-22 TaxID=2937774 RepID=UPI00204634A0|nr:fibronectin type III domain-containing protein [Prevotella sp. E15-22]UPS44533.1 fibronectin type III domain-containing protein [Prevotella sp. E15-22]
MRKQLLSFFTIAWVTLLISAFGISCGGDDSSDGDTGKGGSEQVFTGSVTNLTASSASISCNYTSGKSASSLQLGVMYSTERSVVDNRQGVLCLSSNISGNAYTVELANLQSNTIYYYRAFMISGGNTYYGSVNSFTTSLGGLVNTGDATNITYKSATISSSFRNSAILSYESLGVQYSESKEGFESGYYNWVTTSEITSGNTFTVSLKNLSEQTTYYYRAYVKDYKTTYYGDIKNFTTPKNTINYYGHEYVDLGLPSGTKWATMNVGATTSEESGDYYAWGETTTKTSYTKDNYKWKGLTTDELESRGVVKKVSNSDYTLTANYDVATLKWGSVWRMPTYSEINELEKYTKITATTQNGVNGFLLTSTVNKKTIFFPGAWYWNENGIRSNSDFYRCTCWSSSLNNYYDEYSIALWIDNGSSYGMKNISYTGAERYYGSPVRPVTSY